MNTEKQKPQADSWISQDTLLSLNGDIGHTHASLKEKRKANKAGRSSTFEHRTTPSGSFEYRYGSLPRSLQTTLQLAGIATAVETSIQKIAAEENVSTLEAAVLVVATTTDIAAQVSESELLQHYRHPDSKQIEYWSGKGYSIEQATKLAGAQNLLAWLGNKLCTLNKSESDALLAVTASTIRQNQLKYLPKTAASIRGNINRVLNGNWNPIEGKSALKNAQKLNGEAKTFLFGLYNAGNVPSMKDVHRLYLQECETRRQNAQDYKPEQRFTPVTYQLVANFLKEMAQHATLRMGEQAHRLTKTPGIYQVAPKPHQQWQVDGTIENLFVYDELSRKTKMSIYSVYVVESHSKYLSITTGTSEKGETVIQALQSMALKTGYLPVELVLDGGPAFNTVESWCAKLGIVCVKRAVGNARGKYIESVIGNFQQRVTKFAPGNNFTGANRDSTGKNSQCSVEWIRAALDSHTSREACIEWLENDAVRLWNNHTMETNWHKPCNKSPLQLLKTAILTATPKLEGLRAAQAYGICRTAKLKTQGLQVQIDGKQYVYYPAVAAKMTGYTGTAEAVSTLTDVFYEHIEQALTLYSCEAGGTAWVFDSNGKALGLWEVREGVSAALTEQDETSAKHLRVATESGKALRARTRALADKGKQATEHIRITPFVGLVDKQALAESEEQAVTQRLPEQKKRLNRWTETEL